MSQVEPEDRIPTAASIEQLSCRAGQVVAELPTALGDPHSVRNALLSNAHAHPDAPAFVFRTGSDWTTWTWSDTARIAVAVGRVLTDRYQIPFGNAIVLNAPNGPAWLALDLGAQMAGAFTIPIYAGAPPELVGRAAKVIGANARPKLVATHRSSVANAFLGNADYHLKLETLEPLCDMITEFGTRRMVGADGLVLHGEETASGIYVRPRAEDPESGQVLAVSHSHIWEQCAALRATFECRGVAEPGADMEKVDKRLSVMPWAHIIERIQAVYLSIVTGMPTFVPCDRRDVLGDFKEVQPTLFSASSHYLEHLRHKVITAIDAQVGDVVDLPKAFSDLETESARRLLDRKVPPDMARRCKKWRKQIDPVTDSLLGSHLRLLTSASRLFEADTMLFYEAIGHRVYRSYGGNWLGGLVTTTSPNNWQFDSFGTALAPYSISADTRLRVGGPMVSRLPFDNADSTEFVDTIETVDVAEIDDGWLRIFGTDDRLSSGRISIRGINVAPTKEESYLMNDPLVDQAVAVGESMFIVAKQDALADWARRWGVVAQGPIEQHPSVIERFQVLTTSEVALRHSRSALFDGVPRLEFWSHVDEVDAALSVPEAPLTQSSEASAVEPIPVRPPSSTDTGSPPERAGEPQRFGLAERARAWIANRSAKAEAARLKKEHRRWARAKRKDDRRARKERRRRGDAAGEGRGEPSPR